MPAELQTDDRKVKGCVSQVFIASDLVDGRMSWQGDSDALITKGLLALLIKGLSDLTPDQVMAVDPGFIAATDCRPASRRREPTASSTSCARCRAGANLKQAD